MSTRLTLVVVVIASMAVPRVAHALPDAEIAAVPSTRVAFVRSLVPGLGQLDRGERVKGWTVVAAEGVVLAAALGFQIAADVARRDASADFHVASWQPGAFAAGQRLAQAATQRARFRDGFLFAAATVWALSFADAYLSRSRAAEPWADEATGSGPVLLPTASIARGGLVAGLSMRF
jgi:hypothetical protein